jgi:hypothetical protein
MVVQMKPVCGAGSENNLSMGYIQENITRNTEGKNERYIGGWGGMKAGNQNCGLKTAYHWTP